ncbi:MAG: hypothetical protein M0C28_05775 [Candidatus Moduliflexus flocculans]|nr:hypothetical protein [Candidatus Moduliflexus flocculans]
MEFQAHDSFSGGADESRVSVPAAHRVRHPADAAEPAPRRPSWPAGPRSLGRRTYAYLLTAGGAGHPGEGQRHRPGRDHPAHADHPVRPVLEEPLPLLLPRRRRPLGRAAGRGRRPQGPACGPTAVAAARRPPAGRRGHGLPRHPAGDDPLPDPRRPQDRLGRGHQEGLFPDGPQVPSRPLRPQASWPSSRPRSTRSSTASPTPTGS